MKSERLSPAATPLVVRDSLCSNTFNWSELLFQGVAKKGCISNNLMNMSGCERSVTVMQLQSWYKHGPYQVACQLAMCIFGSPIHYRAVYTVYISVISLSVSSSFHLHIVENYYHIQYFYLQVFYLTHIVMIIDKKWWVTDLFIIHIMHI